MAKKVKKAGEEQLLDIVVQGMQELKAKNIVILDLRKLESAMADYFVIASGSSSTHVEAIANSVEKFTEENLDESPRRIEGKRNGKWGPVITRHTPSNTRGISAMSDAKSAFFCSSDG